MNVNKVRNMAMFHSSNGPGQITDRQDNKCPANRGPGWFKQMHEPTSGPRAGPSQRSEIPRGKIVFSSYKRNGVSSSMHSQYSKRILCNDKATCTCRYWYSIGYCVSADGARADDQLSQRIAKSRVF